jgi:hypothetical protein
MKPIHILFVHTYLPLLFQKSPQKTPIRERQRTQSQTSIGSTGSKGRRQRTTSFASSNGSRRDNNDEDQLDEGDQTSQNKTTPKQGGRKRQHSINFNDPKSVTNKTGNLMEAANQNNVVICEYSWYNSFLVGHRRRACGPN